MEESKLEWDGIRLTLIVKNSNMDFDEKIRKIALDKETVYTCYILDTSRKIVGIVDVKELLIAQKNTLIKDIMDTNHSR